MSRLFAAAWWRSIAGALARTGLAALVPFIPLLLANPAGTWRVATLTVALALVLAVASALGSLPDPTSGTWWEIATQRALRQFGQMVAAAAASAALLTDVHWRAVLVAAASSALSTLVIAALASLPASPPPAVGGITFNVTATARTGADEPSVPHVDDAPRHLA